MWSQQNVGDRLGCGRNQKLQKGLLHSFFWCLHVSSVAFRFHLLLAEFPQWVFIYVKCYAPARLTRVIAQASLGSPYVSVRLRVLGGWVGILLGTLRVLRNFLGRTWYNKFWKLFYRSFFAWVIFRNLSL